MHDGKQKAKGGFTALVGESGCGKSTVAGILMGRNKGYSGQVKVGGVELADIAEPSLMEGITYIPTLALMSSFGPCVALANLGSTLQNTFAAGNRVLDILEEEPLVEEVTGQSEVGFTGAKAENLSFSWSLLIVPAFSFFTPSR